jgi:hypothetical protein
MEPTAVDDVRRVRVKMSKRFSNDIDKLAEHAHEVARKSQKKLGLRSLSRPMKKQEARHGPASQG